MIPRTLEPEVMDSATEALDYDSMDHSDVNRAFVDDFLAALALAGRLTDQAHPLRVLDAGTGTAQIPIELCRRTVGCSVTAIDLAGEMLKVAEQNVVSAGFGNRIQLQRVDSKQLPDEDASFDAVISNSIVHHIPEPKQVLAEMARVVRPGGVLFVRDLLRPNDLETVSQLVETYAGQSNTHQQQMFRDSLCAALTLNEMRQLLVELDLPDSWISQTTDRHWTIIGQL